MAGTLLLFSISSLLGYFISVMASECCREKSVGGIGYHFLTEGDTREFECLNNCIYEQKDAPGQKFCFKSGLLETECKVSECEYPITRINVLSINNFSPYNLAMDGMKKDTSKTGFSDIGSYHGKPFRCSWDQKTVGHENGCCIDHWSQVSKRENFITWHRLYTYNMEQSLLKHSLPRGVLGMPYWDWTSPPNSVVQLPPLANQGEWENGPLPGGGVTHRNPNFRSTNYFRGLVKTAFKQTNYVQFNQQIVLPHKMIHGNIGGDMGNPTYASYDPVFYLHHSYVDLQFAYYQELQRLRLFTVDKKSFCKQAQSAPLQPFASKHVNPLKPSRDNSVGYQTLNYEKNFCYNFSELLFDGLTPEQFIEKEKQEMKAPSILAAVSLNSTGYPSTVEFELYSTNLGSLAEGTFHSLAKGQDQNFSAYNSFLVHYFDFTDIVGENHDLDKLIAEEDLKVRITNITNGQIESAYQPMIVYRPANSAQHTYMIHLEDIAKYAPIIHVQPGAKLQFLDENGIPTTDASQEVIKDENGLEVEIGITTDLTLKYNEHTFVHSPTGIRLKIGHSKFFECDASGDPTCDPEYFNRNADAVTVIHWDPDVSNQVVTAVRGKQILLLAWCHGQKANVNMVSEEDFIQCSNLDATGALDGPASAVVPTDVAGTYYFANGINGACNDGWKLKVEVIEAYSPQGRF